MRTPKNYTQLVNDKKITNEMIAECIYSVNKRAKNHRDKIRKYKDDHYNQYTVRNIENAEDERSHPIRDQFQRTTYHAPRHLLRMGALRCPENLGIIYQNRRRIYQNSRSRYEQYAHRAK